MSLVNQVLKDLQDRRSEPADTSGLHAAAGPRGARGALRWLTLALGAVVVGLGAFQLERTLAPAAPEVEQAAEQVVLAAPLPADPTPTATIAPELQPVEEVVIAEPELEPEPEPELVVAAAPTPGSNKGSESIELDVGANPRAPVDNPPTTLTRTLVTTTPRERAQQAYAAGVSALSEGRRGSAETQFRTALGHDASLRPARLALANLLAGNGELREAEVLLQEGLRIAPSEWRLAERYARLLYERGDLGGAIGVLAAAPPPVGSQPEYHALLATLQQRAGNHDAAAASYAALVDVKPDQGLWWMGLAISLEAQARPQAAYDAYQRAARDGRLAADVADFVRQRSAALAPAGPAP